MAIDGSRSNFPDGVDKFPELFDLSFDMVQKANRLTELKGKASDNLTNDEQNEIKTLTASLKDYMITPETFNHFQDALYAVEEFFYDNVQGFIEEKQVIWDSYIKSFKYVGKWKSGTKYSFQNMVTNEKGDLYICKETHTANSSSNPTTNTRYWQQASAKGEKGDTGLNAIYKGDWNSSTNYNLGDAVCFGRVGHKAGVDYIALRNNVGKSPDTSPDDWTLFQKVYVGTERPIGAGEGLHFIHEI